MWEALYRLQCAHSDTLAVQLESALQDVHDSQACEFYMFENLTRVQERCTALLEETRLLKARLAEADAKLHAIDDATRGKGTLFGLEDRIRVILHG